MEPSPGTEMPIYAGASGPAWLGVCEYLCVCVWRGEAEAGSGEGSALPQFRCNKTRSLLPLGL